MTAQSEETRSGTPNGRWTPAEARDWIVVPEAGADKYSRGVLGVLTGSVAYPGAAVLGVEAALRTGLGMVRYLGPERAQNLVLQRRPETVVSDGRVQAWLIGSGMDPTQRSPELHAQLVAAVAQNVPVVLDAGALDLIERATGATLITPHHGELAALLTARGVSVQRREVSAEPERWAVTAAALTSTTVVLKGPLSHIAEPGGRTVTVVAGPPWAATAGAGDVLAGVLGALLAGHSEAITANPGALLPIAATGALLHGVAAARASTGGPLLALGIAEALPAAVLEVLG